MLLFQFNNFSHLKKKLRNWNFNNNQPKCWWCQRQRDKIFAKKERRKYKLNLFIEIQIFFFNQIVDSAPGLFLILPASSRVSRVVGWAAVGFVIGRSPIGVAWVIIVFGAKRRKAGTSGGVKIGGADLGPESSSYNKTIIIINNKPDLEDFLGISNLTVLEFFLNNKGPDSILHLGSISEEVITCKKNL